jgi:glycosyltransferase involved in cell wall biosynthesis
MIKIACLLPVWKGDDSIVFKLAVDSVINQLLSENIKLTIFFCIDGNLKRSQLQIIKQSSNFVSTVNINNKYKRGLANNLNSGLEEVLKGGFDYIARMDADDICMDNRFSVQLKYLKENQDVDVVGSWSEIIDKNSFTVGTKRVDKVVSFDSLMSSCEVIHPAVMFRGDFFSEYGFYDGFYEKSQDWELWLRACQKGAVIKNIQQSLLKLRIDSNLVSRRKNEQYFNRKIIFKYSKGLVKYKGIARSWLIELLPVTVLRAIVNRIYQK